MYKCFVAIGDSLTEGFGDEVKEFPKIPWPEGVAKILGIEKVINLGVSGYRSDQVFEEQFPKALELKPDLVSIMVGGNDLFQLKLRKRAYYKRMKTMIEAFTKAGATVVTGNLPDITYRYKLPFYKKIGARYLLARTNKTIDKLAKDYKTVHINFWRHPLSMDIQNWSTDNIHPNSKGYTEIAKEIAGTIINYK